MENQIIRVQEMLVAAGAGASTLACAAAKAGDIDTMQLLFAEYGASVFSSDGAGKAPTAYESAIAGNCVAALKWLRERDVLPEFAEYEKKLPDRFRSEGLFSARLAALAAEKGAFEVLEYIADQMPDVRLMPLAPFAGQFDFSTHVQYGAFARKHTFLSSDLETRSPVSYSGLLVICAIAQEAAGKDSAPVKGRLGAHMASGGASYWSDLELALQFDRPELSRILLDSGARINLFEIVERLRQYLAPARALEVMADRLTARGGAYEDLCEPHHLIGAGRKSEVVESMSDLIASKSGFWALVGNVAAIVRKIDYDIQGGAKGEGGDSMDLARQMVRFLKSVDQVLAGPPVLSAAISHSCDPLIRALLEELDPNQYPAEELRRAHPDLAKARELPVHCCRDSKTLDLLVAHGADVNLPLLDREENLLYMVCTAEGGQDPFGSDMFDALAQHGADFGRTFGRKAASSLVKKSGGARYERFMAARTVAAIRGSIDTGDAKEPARGGSDLTAL